VSISTDPDPQQPDPKRPRIKREHLIWAAAALLVLVLGVGVAALIAQRRVDNKEKAELLGGQAGTSGAVVSIGPLDGTVLADYLPERRAALDKASGQRAAVVSLDNYLTEPEARAAVGQLKVIALLAAPPGAAPSVATGDMAAWAQQQKAQATQERDGDQEYLKNGVDDPDYRAFYQSEVTRLNRVLGGIDPKGKVVFGVVVSGPAADLQALTKKAGVRLVDVAPSDKVDDRTEYRGIRPDQTTTVNQHDPRPF
jgi:hypothetical protein